MMMTFHAHFQRPIQYFIFCKDKADENKIFDRESFNNLQEYFKDFFGGNEDNKFKPRERKADMIRKSNRFFSENTKMYI